MKYTTENLNFDNSANVISSAQKFVLPIPSFSADKGEALVYPEGENKGQAITDWQGQPIGDSGVVFYNAKDKSFQAVAGDGNGVIIMNQVSEQQAKQLATKIKSTLSRDDLNLESQSFEATGAQKHGLVSASDMFNRRTVNDLELSEIKQILDYAVNDLGVDDMYNSDKGFIASKMTPVGQESGFEAYGIHKRDDRDICQAVYIAGKGEFEGPAATPQQFDQGAVILKQGDSVRLIQPKIFEETYRGTDGSILSVSQLPLQGNTADDRFPSANSKHNLGV